VWLVVSVCLVLCALIFTLLSLYLYLLLSPSLSLVPQVGNAGISQHVHELCLEMDYLGIFTASVILSFTQAVFVYPWWATCVNVGVALSLTAYLVRRSLREGGKEGGREGGREGGVFSYQPLLSVSNPSDMLQIPPSLPPSLPQITHLRQVVVCHIGRLRMLLEIGSLYQLPLWYQAYLDCTSSSSSSSSSLPPSLASSLHPSLPVSLLCAMGMTGSLVIGGLTYAVHFPECFAPGKFDVWVSKSLPSLPPSLPPCVPACRCFCSFPPSLPPSFPLLVMGGLALR